MVTSESCLSVTKPHPPEGLGTRSSCRTENVKPFYFKTFRNQNIKNSTKCLRKFSQYLVKAPTIIISDGLKDIC